MKDHDKIPISYHTFTLDTLTPFGWTSALSLSAPLCNNVTAHTSSGHFLWNFSPLHRGSWPPSPYSLSLLKAIKLSLFIHRAINKSNRLIFTLAY
jgi:hypothetical protein